MSNDYKSVKEKKKATRIKCNIFPFYPTITMAFPIPIKKFNFFPLTASNF